MICGILVTLVTGEVWAQTDLQPTVGYQFGGRYRFYEGDIKLQNAMNYGITLDHELMPGIMIELYYTQMNTDAEWRPAAPRYDNLLPRNFKTDVHYFQLGGLKYVDKGNIQPFGAFTLGATWFHSYESDKPAQGVDNTLFSITLGGGVKIMFSEKVGIRLQGRLLMPMYFNGLFLGVGTGGASLGATSTIPIVQGDFTGGLVFRLGGSGGE